MPPVTEVTSLATMISVIVTSRGPRWIKVVTQWSEDEVKDNDGSASIPLKGSDKGSDDEHVGSVCQPDITCCMDKEECGSRWRES